MKTLECINAGETATVKKLYNNDGIKRRLLDLGLTSGTTVECVGNSPFGDPKAFLIRGAVIAIRNDDLKMIEIV